MTEKVLNDEELHTLLQTLVAKVTHSRFYGNVVLQFRDGILRLVNLEQSLLPHSCHTLLLPAENPCAQTDTAATEAKDGISQR